MLNFMFSLLGILMGAVIKIIEFKKLANWKVGLFSCIFGVIVSFGCLC